MSRHDYAMAEVPLLSERDRLRVLSEIHDPQTVRILQRIGLRPGDRCLEVGPGNGSIAAVLAALVGSTGQVVAADVTDGLLADMPANVTFRLCDVRNDDLGGPYDVIHVRHVLFHLRERDVVLRRLSEALRPGGHLVVEDYFFPWEQDTAAVVGTGDRAGANAYVELVRAFLNAVGADWLWAQKLPLRLRELGLEGVHADGWFPPTTGDDDAVLPVREGLIRATPHLQQSGLLDIDDETFRKGIAFASDPETMFLPYLLVSASGRRPAGLA